MPKRTNFFTLLWAELKRRKVFKVLAMYAGTAFIIIQVIDILTNRLNLPPWIATLVIIILSIGFPVTAVLAWIFDLTPEGIKKTESIEKLAGKEIVTPPGRRRLKVGDAAIFVLTIAVIVLAWPKIFKTDTIERLRSSGSKLSVAVMPFQNLTNDTTWNLYREVIQQNLISSLANTGELKVSDKEPINTLLQSKNPQEFASISPAVAGAISKKLDSEISILGNLQKSETTLYINAQLVDTKTNGVFKSFNIEKPIENSNIIQIIDTLSQNLKNYLLISKLIKGNPAYNLNISPLTTNSPEALKYFIYGENAFGKGEYNKAESWYLKALAIDSTYFDPMIGLSSLYANLGMQEENYKWVLKYYRMKNRMKDRWPLDVQLFASWAYAFSFEPPEVGINYLRQIDDLYGNEGRSGYLIGFTYKQMKQFDKAIPEFERHLAMSRKWGKEFLINHPGYSNLGSAYHQTDQYKKEKKLVREAKKYNKDNPYILTRQISISLTERDTVAVNRYISELKKTGISDPDIAGSLGRIYSEEKDPVCLDKAEEYFLKALSLNPKAINTMNFYADFLIDKRRNLDKVSELMDRAMELARDKVVYYNCLDKKGWALYKQGKYKEALEIIQKAWDEAPYKLYSIRSHLEEVKKAAKEQGLI